MRTIRLALFSFVLAGTVASANEIGAQGSTAPQSPSMGASQSRSAVDPPPGHPATKGEFDQGYTGQAPGIGEKGSGQGRSTMEREGTPSSDKNRPRSFDRGKDAQPGQQPANDRNR